MKHSLTEDRSTLADITNNILTLHARVTGPDDYELLNQIEGFASQRARMSEYIAELKVLEAAEQGETTVALYRPQQADCVRERARQFGSACCLGEDRAVQIVEELMTRSITVQAAVVTKANMVPITAEASE